MVMFYFPQPQAKYELLYTKRAEIGLTVVAHDHIFT